MFVGRSRKQRAAAATTKTTTRAISSATATAALIGCTLLLSAYLGTHSAWAMSIERLAIERNELQQQTETPAAAVSDNVLVVDDMQLEAVPSVAGDDDNTDMYMLVPANIAAEEEPVPASGNSIDEKLNDEEETAALSGDMLMLETDDAPGMQMVELPSVVPVADEAVLSVNNDDDDNEIESVPELVEEAIEQLVATEAEVPVAVEQAAQQAEVALEEAIVESTTPLADDESLKTDAAEAQQQIVENVAEKIPQIMATLETAPAVDEPLHDEAQVDDKESTNEEQQLISSQDAQNTNAVGELETESVTETALVDAGEELAEQETVTDTIEQVESNEKPNEINEEKQNDGDELAESVTPAQEDSVAAAEEEKEHETAEAEATTEAPLVSEPLEVEAAEATAEQTQQQANDEPEAEQEAAEVQQDDETATTLAPAAVESTDEVATTEASIAESQPQVMANDKDSDKLAEIAEQHIQADEIANNDVLSEHNNEKELPAEAEAQQQEEEQLQTVTEAADIQMDDVDANTPAIDVATTEAAAADEIVDEMPMEIAAEKKEEAVAQPAQMSEAALLGGQQTATTTTTVEDKTEAEETVMTDKDDTPINADDESQQQQTATENLIQMDDAESEHIDELAPVAIVNIEEPTTTHENAEEGNSLLTTIIQVPVQQQQEQQQAAAVETTTQLPQHNVADSVLNYVNASFIQQTTEQTPPLKTEVLATPTEPEAFNAQLRRYDGAQVWRIVVQNDKDKKMADELQTKYDGQLWKEVKQEVDYLLKPQVLAAAERHIRSANLSRIVLIDNLQQVIEVENPSAEEIVMLQNRKGHRLSWQAYHRLEDIHGFIDYMAATYPDICSTETIGYSIQKRPLKILKISNGNASNPSIWLDGGMHAREWISPATVTFIANQLIEGWEDLPEHMRQINYYLHPVANPDGYEYSHTTDRLWRKNLRAHGRQCPGVDLNRNFGYKWGGKGTSASPCSQTYRGSKAFSEPETFYISKFISSYPRNTFQAYLSFHSYGQYILYPWGYDYHLTTDRADLDRVARQAGTSITKSTGVKYTVGSSATTLYPAAGGSDDWAKGIAGIKYAYTVEMGDTGRYGFVLPARFIHSNGKDGYTFIETVARAINEERSKQNRKRALKARRA